MIKINRLYTFITLISLSFYTGFAQESLKKHTVSSGETLLSISKKYNVTPSDLQKANPAAADGVKINDVLVIPESTSKVSSSISHTVKTGESKYSISKRFGITVSDLEAQNPQIVSGLNVGAVLEIFPSTKQDNNGATPPHNPLNKKGKTHHVVSGETLFAISSANGLTVEELVKANSNTISGDLKIGQILWIPGSDDDTASNNGDYVVKYGDTKFSLSRRFNTTVKELERKNPHITKMLIVGQTINMPSSETYSTKTEVAQTEIKNTQVVAPKEEVKEVEKVTPIAQVPSEAPVEIIEKQEEKVANNLSKEIVIKEKEIEAVVSTKVPTEVITKNEKHVELAATETHPEEEIEESSIVAPTVSSDRDYDLYKIQPSETVYGLAKKAGMTVPEFLELNPQLKTSVQIGTFIKMPNHGTSANTISNTVSNDTEALMLPKITEGFADLTTSAKTASSKKLLFFLPFSETEYKNYVSNGDDFKNVSDDFKRSHLEFYKGANIAIDSIRKMNMQLDVNIVEAQSINQTSKTKSLIQDNNLKDYDAIILPFYKSIEDEIAAFTADKHTPVITASPIDKKNNTNNLYSALPSINKQRLKVLNYMMSKQAHIIVLNDVDRVESKNFIADHVPNADFITIKKNGAFSEAELKSKLKKGQLNYVIIDSERNSTFLNTTNALMSELSNHKLQLAVLEPSLIPDDSNVSQKRYQILKMIYPSLIPSKSTENSKQFLSTYQKKYKLLPSANIMLGFDITFDSLLRLMQQQSFENSATNYITEYTQLKFNYEKNTLGGYSNEGIYILQYDTNANIRDAN